MLKVSEEVIHTSAVADCVVRDVCDLCSADNVCQGKQTGKIGESANCVAAGGGRCFSIEDLHEALEI